MSEMIPYGRQDITAADIEAVVDVLQSDFLTQGPAVPRFETEVSRYCGAQHAIAVNSATSALHIACLALGLTRGDIVWTSPITFVASANCALYCEAKVDFVDIDPHTYNISISQLAEKLAQSKKNNTIPKIVIPIHLCGQSCDMETIHELGKQYGFKIIEDASHAIGGKYKNHPIGGCQYSDVTVFSFHPVKIITTGEGGMALTNDEELAKKMALLRSHGVTRDQKMMTHEPDGAWYYQQIALGFNYRMTDMQAALGVSQMERLDQFVERRHELAQRYNELLGDLPLILPRQHSDAYSGLHLYIIRLQLDKIDKTHSEVFDLLRAQQIGINLHYIPVHMQPYYQAMGFLEGDFPEAEKYYCEAISIPMFPGMTEKQQSRVCGALKKVLMI
jgi:UDP-4-amino-4,6-dideoxy-N-acetyl-beta-L-altrosamine transaminase